MSKVISMTVLAVSLVLHTLSAPAFSAPRLILKAGHVQPLGSGYDEGFKAMKEYVENHTNGAIQIDIFGESTLGDNQEMVEGLITGAQDLVITVTSPLVSFVPELGVLDLPFLFKDVDHALQVLNGPLGEDFAGRFDGLGLHVLGWADFGFRHLTNNQRPVRNVADLKGLKIRVMQSEIQLATWDTLGATPVPMSISELLNALQTGVVNGQENPISACYTNGSYSAQKYLSLTGHTYSPSVLMIGRLTWNKLSDEEKNIFEKAGKLMVETHNRVFAQLNEDYADLLKKAGLEFSEVDHDDFVRAVQPVYDRFGGKFTQYLDMIRK